MERYFVQAANGALAAADPDGEATGEDLHDQSSGDAVPRAGGSSPFGR